ncbi:MAG: agmatine deiminase family protein [Saprospiraceae bacterium]|nr:agmatine deiminase family protein [Saprospiraceae bacterium]
MKRIPAEFEKQEAILLAFPHEGADWPGKFNAIQWAFIDFIKKISFFEKVILIVQNQKHQKKVINKLTRARIDLDKIEFIKQDTNRSWMRDSGPIIVYNEKKQREAVRFDFNAWAKYDNFKKDRKIPAVVAKHIETPLIKATHSDHFVIMEGGAIDYNGQGTLITTEECLLHPMVQVRNPDFSQKDYEDVFQNYLGIDQVIWLGEGIEGDDTHGHIDDICRFINPHTVVLAEEKNSQDYNHRVMEENRERLENIRLHNGNHLDVIRIPMPGRIDFEDMRLPASYINFLIINDALLVPTFNDPNDYRVLGILKELMPNHQVIGIHALDLIWGLGTLHCLSHEIPASMISDFGL